MWRAVCTVVTIMLVVVVIFGLTGWWWCETSAGTWDLPVVRWIMCLLWGVAPFFLWVFTFFGIAAFFYKADGTKRWGGER